MTTNGRRRLTGSDYLVRTRAGQDQQVAEARWELLKAVQRVLPEVFEQLRDRVYPAFARLAESQEGYWRTGWRFSQWQSRSDPARQLTPVLINWASAFHLEEEWILQGTLQTLSLWHTFPHLRNELDIAGYRQYVCVPILVTYQEHCFQFEDFGWDPTLLSYEGWRAKVRKRFEAAVKDHGQKMQTLIEARGGVPVVTRVSAEHFEWLALYHCGHVSLESILRRAPYVSDKTTIFKGIRHAAQLAQVKVRRKEGKLKNR